MKTMKKMIAGMVAITILNTVSLSAEDDPYGSAYYDSTGTTSLSPELGVGIIVGAAVIAILINNHDNGHSSHSHTHSHSH